MKENSANYMQVIENSHYWTDLNQLKTSLTLRRETIIEGQPISDYNKLIDHIIVGIDNAINAGYNITRIKGPEPGPETNPLIIDMKETFTKCLDLVIRKNNDYSGVKNADNDPFKNIRGAEFVGVPNERGILVRMMDKMGRISSLLTQDAQVKEESINDTLDDLINYSVILKSYLKNKRNK
jgi:hypothetical protein